MGEIVTRREILGWRKDLTTVTRKAERDSSMETVATQISSHGNQMSKKHY